MENNNNFNEDNILGPSAPASNPQVQPNIASQPINNAAGQPLQNNSQQLNNAPVVAQPNTMQQTATPTVYNQQPQVNQTTVNPAMYNQHPNTPSPNNMAYGNNGYYGTQNTPPAAQYQQPLQSTAAQPIGANSYAPNNTQGYRPYDSGAVQPNNNQDSQEYKWNYTDLESHNSQPKKKNKGLIIFIIILSIAIIGGLVSLSLMSMGIEEPRDSVTSDTEIIDNPPSKNPDSTGQGGEKTTDSTPPTTSEPSNIPVIKHSDGKLLTTPEVAELVTPSVVGVIQYQRSLYEASGLGSGIIIMEKGGYYYIVTNNHVVESGNAFKVRLSDGVEVEATLVGTDKQSDLAVLRIKTDEKLRVAQLGDSDELRVGETVIAIGNPVHLDLSGSVTQGIISALNRTLQADYRINYIQTDAAINPGNSGGALVNMYGQVIGINTAKVQGTGLEGLGFSIPINEARPIIEELISNGKVASRPVLGIQGIAVDEAMSYEYNLPTGIMIKGISNVAKFETKPEMDDIITHIDGVRITNLRELKEELDSHKIGDTVELTIYRENASVKTDDNVKIRVKLIASE